ncbi:Protein turtle [Merluccius polli]|uniref:Protein turtle n=1 Tax=Merluccius polli TaxID=89951 RepID=A0AA47MNQ5_MERPO|nr:Protein turtle [Merluccius polli]
MYLPFYFILILSTRHAVFSAQPQDAVGLLGAPLTLDCAVYDPGQQRALSVRWEKSSGEVHSGSVGGFQLANGSLFFPLLREAHLGGYVCSADAGDHRISATVRVEKAGLDVVFFSPGKQTVREGEAVFLQCVSGDSSPPAVISWMKDGELVKRGKQIQAFMLQAFPAPGMHVDLFTPL